MKNKKHRIIRLGAVVMAAVCLMAGAAIAAGEGTQSDPLVTLSYLTKTVIPAILEQVDGRAQAHQQELVDKLDQSIREYSARMEEVVGEESGEQNAAAYTVVTLKKDQKLSMEVGCEVMLRIGTARCTSPSSPGLISITTGSTLGNGEELVTNQLYMATIAGRGITATANTVKVLVRGSYTIM